MDRPGRWLVTTSGTTHEFMTYEAIYWRRTPAPGSIEAAYDGRFVRLRRLGLIKVGDTFELVVSDGGYLYGATMHQSSTVTRIERIGGHCRRCVTQTSSESAGAKSLNPAGTTSTANRGAGTPPASRSNDGSAGSAVDG